MRYMEELMELKDHSFIQAAHLLVNPGQNVNKAQLTTVI